MAYGVSEIHADHLEPTAYLQAVSVMGPWAFLFGRSKQGFQVRHAAADKFNLFGREQVVL